MKVQGAPERAMLTGALGPGVPDPPAKMKVKPHSRSRHRLREEVAVGADSVLGGLHHEYFLAPRAASLSICR